MSVGRLFKSSHAITVASANLTNHNRIMDVIELECPHCGDALELDAAFAGGVCRCSTCGTLMTVPADPSKDRAETLTRRERPDAPGGRAETPGGARPDVPGGRPSRPDVPGARPDVPGSARDSSADLGELAGAGTAAPQIITPASDDLYITSSGKSLKLATAVVPTARKKKKVIRGTIIAGFVLFVLGIVGIIFLAIKLLFSATDKPGDITVPDHVGIDPAVNPITKSELNLLNVPLGSEVAIVVDGTSFARVWYPKVREIIGHAASQSATVDYMIIPWTDLNPKSFPGKKPEKIGQDKLTKLDDFLSISNVGSTSPAPFVELALEQRADQIVLVVGRSLEESEVASLRDAIAKRVDTRFDVIVIGDHDEALQKLAKDNKGVYISVKIEQIEKWYDQWKKGGKTG